MDLSNLKEGNLKPVYVLGACDINNLTMVEKLRVINPATFYQGTKTISTASVSRLKHVSFRFSVDVEYEAPDDIDAVNKAVPIDHVELQNYTPSTESDLTYLSNYDNLGRLIITTSHLWPDDCMETLTTLLKRLIDYNIIVNIDRNTEQYDVSAMLVELANMKIVDNLEIDLNTFLQNHQVVFNRMQARIIFKSTHVDYVVGFMRSTHPSMRFVKIYPSDNISSTFTAKQALKSIDSSVAERVIIECGLINEGKDRLEDTAIDIDCLVLKNVELRR